MQSLLKNNWSSLVAIVIRLLSVALLFALTVTLARFLGPEQLGIYAIFFALMQVSVAVGRGGLIHTLVRDIAVARAEGDVARTRGYLLLGWMVALPMSAIVTAVFVFFLFPAFATDFSLSVGPALAGAAFIAAMVLVGMLEAAIRASGWLLLGQTAEYLVRPLTQLILVLLASFGFFGVRLDLEFALGAAMASALIAFAFAFCNYLCTTEFLDPSSPRNPVKSGYLRSLAVLSSVVWVGSLNSHVNLIILGMLGDEIGAGFFQISVQLTTVMTMGLVAANASMAPEIGRLIASGHENNLKRLQNLVSRSCELSLAFGLPLAGIYIVFGSALLPIVFGDAYIDAYWPTVILAFGQVLNIGFGSVVIVLYSNHQENVTLKAIITATIFNIALCLLLIPHLGAIGAAIASTVSMALWNFISFWGLARSTGILSLPLIPAIKGNWGR